MTDWTKLGMQGADAKGDRLTCEMCDAMCLDAVDGTLTAAEQIVYERHVAGCVTCAEQLAEAHRGAAWMEMLKGHAPEPPAELLTKILAQTSGLQVQAVAAPAAPMMREEAAQEWAPHSVAQPSLWARLKEKAGSAFRFDAASMGFQPRLVMTAAMAFFSIALTMNLSGIRLNDLRPSMLHRTVSDAEANAAREFQSMKVVYQVESKVSDLRQDEKLDQRDRQQQRAEPQPQPAAPQQQQPEPDKKQTPPDGTSELVMPAARLDRVSESSTQQAASATYTPAMQKGA